MVARPLIRSAIITSTLNCTTYLASTADSIRVQTHLAVQWIGADGGADLLVRPHTLFRIASDLSELSPTTIIAYGNVVQCVASAIYYCFGEVGLAGWELYRRARPCHQRTLDRATVLQGQRRFETNCRVVSNGKATLFEGGPGGGAVYDGIALGSRCLVSDIEVNREINEPEISFFSAKDPAALAALMAEVLSDPCAVRPSAERLAERGRARRVACGEQLLAAIRYVRP